MDNPTIESWPRCPGAAQLMEEWLHTFLQENPPLAEMEERFRCAAGVRLASLVDHWVMTESSSRGEELARVGYVETVVDGDGVWVHPEARLPRVRLLRSHPRLALAAEDVDRFLEANGLRSKDRRGEPDSCYEEARVRLPYGELAVVARRGYAGYRPGTLRAAERTALSKAREALGSRDRSGDEMRATERAAQLIAGIAGEIGRDRAVDELFSAERDYYLTRNAAARWQYARQCEMGFGWANHDHHTYRSSRTGFRSLINLWHSAGFASRERFYAGVEAGWGAQVLEHPVSRVVLFCDVDMAPEELNIDFAAEALPPRDSLGTIGLWCALHSSSIGQAGLHHLECEFDFAQAQANLEAAGFAVMAPFTDLPMLKQAFTLAEVWPVDPARLESLRSQGLITPEQAARFAAQGANGSHLEILQRWEGFKGFNKTGINTIIRATDARR